MTEIPLQRPEFHNNGESRRESASFGWLKSWFKWGTKELPGAEDCLPAAKIQQLRSKITNVELKEDTAEELSASLALAERIRSRRLYIDQAGKRLEAIVGWLVAEKPSVLLAREARIRLQFDVYRHHSLFMRLLTNISEGSPTALVICALLASSTIWTAFVLGILLLAKGISAIGVLFVKVRLPDIPQDVFFVDHKPLLVIITAAFMGGVVSIATRMREFTRIRDLDPFAMFWTALLKPLIGVVLSIFLLATLAAGMISFGFLPEEPFGLKPGPSGGEPSHQIAEKTLYALWVLGFLIGFSERFAWDFVDRARGIASGGGDKDTR